MDSRITNLIVAAVFTERTFFIEFTLVYFSVTLRDRMFRLHAFSTALLGLVALAAVLAVIALALVRPLVILVLSAGCETFPALRTPVRVPTCRTKQPLTT